MFLNGMKPAVSAPSGPRAHMCVPQSCTPGGLRRTRVTGDEWDVLSGNTPIREQSHFFHATGTFRTVHLDSKQIKISNKLSGSIISDAQLSPAKIQVTVP